jgi:hypothetical protein
MVNAIQEVFKADLNNTILLMNYFDPAIYDELSYDYPRWVATVQLVDWDRYKDCTTFEEFHAIKNIDYSMGRYCEEYSLRINALTGEVIHIINYKYDESTQYKRGLGRITPGGDKQLVEQKYRDYVQEILPNLTIAFVEFVEDYLENGTVIEICHVAMSDGCLFIFDRIHLGSIEYFTNVYTHYFLSTM